MNLKNMYTYLSNTSMQYNTSKELVLLVLLQESESSDITLHSVAFILLEISPDMTIMQYVLL